VTEVLLYCYSGNGGGGGGGGGGGNTGCVDKNANCGSWAQSGYCVGQHGPFMKQNCCKSCKSSGGYRNLKKALY